MTSSNPTTLAEWIARVEARETHIAIIGLGYVGLPLTLLFAQAGFRVTGFDIDPTKVKSLNEGRSYIHRISSAEIATARAAGFTATTDFSLLRDCNAVLICVPTPLRSGHEPDLSHEPSGSHEPDSSHEPSSSHEPDMSYVQHTVEALAPHTHPGQLIVLESTTYPGTTTELVLPILERLGPTPVLRGNSTTVHSLLSTHCLLAFSPEREDPGNTTTPRRAIPKVVGGTSPSATAAAAALYGAIFDRTVSVSSTEAAEMTKLLENIYRSVNIALVNELKQLCLAMGIDIWEVIDAASTKPFGFQPFYPGPGIGGHCIPVDPFYLSWRARQFNQPTRFIELAGEINEAMPAFVVETARKALGSLEGKRVLLLGIAYKRDVDDLRESPALTLFSLLQHAGAHVAYNDPFFPQVGIGRHYDLQTASTPLAEVPTFDCVLLATDHTAYDIPTLVAASKLFIDTRNATRGLTAANIVRC